MAPFSWFRWLRSIFHSRTKTYRRRPNRRLSLEHLEDRLTPSTFTWKGGAAGGNLWSIGANWVSATGTAPTNGSDLVFSSASTSAGNFLTLDNIAGLSVDSVTISSSSTPFDLKPLVGQQLTLNGLSGNGGGTITVTGGTPTSPNLMEMDLILGAGSTLSQDTISVNNGSVFQLNGHLIGTANAELIKNQVGTLILTADNSGGTVPANGMNGPVEIKAGVLDITNANSLGNAASASNITTVDSASFNGTLEVDNSAGTITSPIAESLILNGPGSTNVGALLYNDGGVTANTATWSGPITMDSNSTIGALNGGNNTNTPTATGALTITGVIGNNVPHNLTKEGAGEIILDPRNPGGIYLGNTYGGQTIINNGILDIENPNALGTGDDTASTGTVVNNTLTEAGTLEIDGNVPGHPSFGGGFTVANEMLTLNGVGSQNIAANDTTPDGAALDNVSGNNTWAGKVVLGGTGSTVAPVNVGTGLSFGILTASQVGNIVTITTTAPNNLVVGEKVEITGVGVAGYNGQFTISGVNAATNTFTYTDTNTSLAASFGGTAVVPTSLTIGGLNSITETVTLPAATGGTFKLSVNGQTTTALAFNATAAQVQSALSALSTVGTNNLSVTASGNGGPYSVTFTGTPANSPPVLSGTPVLPPVPVITATSSLTGTVAGATIGIATTGVNAIAGPDITSPNGAFPLDKVGPGTLIFTTANSYTGATTVANGILEIEDSNALGGKTGATFAANANPGVTVVDGASLVLAVDFLREFNLNDSGTGNTNHLTVGNALSLNGLGFDPGTGPIGALLSHDGINTYAGTISLDNLGGDPSGDSIGVDPAAGVTPGTVPGTADPFSTPAGAPFNYDVTSNGSVLDDSLTANSITGGGSPGLVVFPGPQTSWAQLNKVGGGQLILPKANSYIGPTDINAGWVTIENASSLGIPDPAVSANVEPLTTVASGAALHLLSLTGSGITLTNSLVLSGDGINYDYLTTGLPVYPLVNNNPANPIDSHGGALVSLAGVNTITGNIALIGETGIGVEQIYQSLFATTSPNFSNNVTSQLTLTGESSDGTSAVGITTPGGIVKLGSQRLIVQGQGSNTGNVDIRGGVVLDQNNTGLGAGNVLTPSSVTVEVGAALELANGTAAENGGVAAGIEVDGQSLILNGTGNSTFGDTAPLVVLSQASGYEQVVSFTNAVANTTKYKLSFNGVTTAAAITYTGVGGTGAGSDAAAIQAGLLGLSSVSSASGTVGVTPNSSDTAFTIVFGGGLLGTTQVVGITVTASPATATVNPAVGPIFDPIVSTQDMWSGPVAANTSFAVTFQPVPQVVTFTNPVVATTKYNLTFNGIQTATLNYTGVGGTGVGSDAAVIQAALNSLTTVGGIGGSVTVTPNGTDTAFTVNFGGTLLGTTQQLSAAVTGGTATAVVTQPTLTVNSSLLTGTAPSATVTTTTPGGLSVNQVETAGQFLNLVQTLEFNGSNLAGTFTLSFNGQTTAPIAWSSNAPTLQASIQSALNAINAAGLLGATNPAVSAPLGMFINIQAPATNQPDSGLVLGGTIDDSGTVVGNADPFIGGADLTVTGTGEVDLAGANLYRGTTTVSTNVILGIENGQALGSSGTSEQRTITFSNAAAGTAFDLTFGGLANQTGTITLTGTTAAQVAADALTIQTALNKLATIGGGTNDVGGSVSVSSSVSGTSEVFTVTFNGSLSGFNLVGSPLTASITGGPGTVAVATTVTGTGGTIVQNGGALQLQGDLSVAGEPLLVQGQGLGSAANVAEQWFAVGPAPTTNGQTAGNGNVTGRVTGILVDPTDPNTIYIATAGGGAWKTIDGGNTWRPLFNGIPEVQTVALSSATVGNTFTLTVTSLAGGSATTPTLTLTGTAADAINIQNALNALSTVGGLGGSVTVTQTGNGAFQLKFSGGTLNGVAVPQLTGTATTGTVTSTITTNAVGSAVALFTGALTFGASSSTIFLGTGETNNSSDSFYGTGIYESTDSGVDWTLLTGDGATVGTQVTQANPFNGKGISAMTFGGGNLFVASGDGGTGKDESQQISPNIVPLVNSVSFTITIHTGSANFTTVFITLTNPATNGGDGFGGATDVTDVNQLTTDLDAAVASVGGLFNVTYNAPTHGHGHGHGGGSPASFTIQYAGNFSLSGFQNLTTSLPLPGPGIPPSTIGVNEVVKGGPLTVVNGTGGGPGIYRIQPGAAGTAGAWFDLTNVISGVRSSTADKAAGADPLSKNATTSQDPDSPGPDDDFRIAFPQNDATWTSLAFTGNTLIAALGGAGGSLTTGTGNSSVLGTVSNNGVFWMPGPTTAFTGISFINGAAVPNDWYVGEPVVAGTPAVFTPDNESTNQFVPLAAWQPLPNTAAVPPGVPVPDQIFGDIKIAAVGTTLPPGTVGTIEGSVFYSGPTVYASAATPSGALEGIFVSPNGGQDWLPVTLPPTSYFSQLGGEGKGGNYDSAILVDPNDPTAETLFVAGQVDGFPGGASQIWKTTNLGGNWTDISVDSLGNGPHSEVHAMTLDINGSLDVATDGGVWQLNSNTSTWIDLNGNLADAQINSVATNPTQLNNIIAGSQMNGIDLYSGNPAWTNVDPASTTFNPPGSDLDGGEVQFNPKNGSIVYAVATNPSDSLISGLYESTSGGAAGTWNLVLTVPFTPNAGMLGGEIFPFAIDQVNPSRLVVGGVFPGTVLQQSLDGGASWVDLSPNLPGAFSLGAVTSVALGNQQGQFQADPGFTDVTDQGANAYVPGTIYITDGANIAVTKDLGQTWQIRTPPAALGSGSIAQLVVDPRNRDTVYAVENAFGTGQVLESTDAGQDWADVGTGNGLPNIPAWSLAIDPRNGALYVGTDEGVFTSTNGGASWTAFGAGMADVQVTSLDLNETTNLLTAGTNGGGVYQISLDGTPGFSQGTSESITLSGATGGTTAIKLTVGGVQTGPISYAGIAGTLTDATAIQTALNNLSTIKNVGGFVTVSVDPTDSVFTVVFGGTLLGTTPPITAVVSTAPGTISVLNNAGGGFTAISGQSTWTGPVVLAGNTSIGADGTQALQDGVSTAQITIVGSISDQVAGQTNTLTKVGDGTVALAAQNVFAGQTVVAQGVLEVSNPNALSGVSTTVLQGAALWLESSLNLEPITLNGDGIPFNDHNTGALRSVSANNTYTGPITLNSDSTIGVDSGSMLTIGDGLGDGSISGPHNLVKELTGTLVFDDANSYGSGSGFFDAPNILNDPADTLYAFGTLISQGVLTIEHPAALGLPGNTTTVLDGAQLQIEAVGDIQQIITLTGATAGATPTKFNLTFGTQTTATPLTYSGVGATDAANILAALQGLSSIGATGVTGVTANADDNAFTVTFGGTLGKQNIPLIQVGVTQTAATAAVNIGVSVPASQNLRLSGAGVVGSGVPGALASTGGVNAWNGTVTLSQDAGFSPTTVPPAQVGIGVLPPTVASPADSLTINGVITQNAIPLTTVPATANPVNFPPLGIDKIGTGLLILDPNSNKNTYTGGTTVGQGVVRIQTSDALGGAAASVGGLPEVQTVTVTGTSGTFTLTFKGQSVTETVGATAAQVQTDLNGLTNISAGGGKVDVFFNSTTGVYTIAFDQGPLATTLQPAITTTTTTGVVATVQILGVTVDTGASLQLDGTAAALDVKNQNLFLNGFGFNNGGALENFLGNNKWDALSPVTLQSAAAIGADGATVLTVAGTIQDGTPAQFPIAASLAKVGPGTVIIPAGANNTYAGETDVDAGILNIQSAHALGFPLVNDVQTVAVNGSSGTFSLTFNGQTTAQIPVNPALPAAAQAAAVQAALDALSTIGGVGGSVSVAANVSATQTLFTITFSGGTLAGKSQPLLSAFGQGGPTTVVNFPVNGGQVDGSHGTVVNNGGTLQIQGGITITAEPLTLNGTGSTGTNGALESVSGNNAVAAPVTLGSNASIGVDSATLTLSGVIGDNGNGFGLTKFGPGTAVLTGTASNTYTGTTTVSDGTLQLGKLPGSAIQTVTVDGSAGSFQLTFNGQTTGILAFNVPASGGVGATASVQNALQALSTVGAGNVFVTQTGNIYTITFTGALANEAQPQITATGTGGTTTNFATIQVGNPAPVAVDGNLVVGDGNPADPLRSDIAQLEASNEIVSTASVTTNSDGLFDLHGFVQTVTNLTMNGGAVTDSAASPFSSLTVNGNVQASADSNGNPATIDSSLGSVVLAPLSGTATTFTVNGAAGGDAPPDLVIGAPITGAAGLTMATSSTGTLELTNTETYTGATTLNGGDLEVDGSVGTVTLAGGTLSGTGTVAVVTSGTPAGTTPSGVSPGTLQSGASPLPGILTINSATQTVWNATTGFHVDLGGHGAGNGAGNFSQLDVTGTGGINLGNAVLTGQLTGGFLANLNDSFTILKTSGGGQITGIFSDVNGHTLADGGTLFVGTQKFRVNYTATTVVLTNVKFNAVVTVTSSVAPTDSSVYGQDVSFTATVSPETGASVIPVGSVTFTITSNTAGSTFGSVTITTSTATTVGNSSVFTIDPESLAVPEFTFAPDSYSVTAQFSPANTSPYQIPAPVTLTPEKVTQDPTAVSFASSAANPNPVSPASPVFGQSVTLTVSINPNPAPNTPPGTFFLPGDVNPGTGTVIFTVDNVAQTPVVVSHGLASITLPNLGAATHVVRVTFSGDADYLGSNDNLSPFLFAVAKDSTTVGVSATVNGNPATSSAVGQAVTLIANVTAGNGTGLIPDGTVTFHDGSPTGPVIGPAGGTQVPSSGPNAGQVSVTVSNLIVNSSPGHTIFAVYSGSFSYTGSNGSMNFVVNQDSTNTAVMASPNPTTTTTPVTLTATVSNTSGVNTTPTGGTVTFTDTFNTVTTTLGTANLVNGTAVLIPGSTYTGIFVSQGQHLITATYSGVSSGNFAGSSGFTLENVNTATTTTVAANPTSIAFGGSVTFTATITAASGVPSGGTVTFRLDNSATGTILGQITIVSGATNATASTGPISPNIPAGTHTIFAAYSGSGFFNTSSGQLNNFTVTKTAPASLVVTATVNSTSATSSIYGQPITFTATVTGVNGVSPTGTINFSGITGQSGTNGVTLQSGPGGTATATFTTSATTPLLGGTYSVTAAYLPGTDPNYSSGSPSPTFGFTVNRAGTNTALSASPSSGDVFGESVTLTATVTNTDDPATVAEGDVTFTAPGFNSGPVKVNGSGVATLTTTALAPSAGETITASYSDTTGATAPDAGPDFTGSADNTSVTGYTVSSDSTAVTNIAFSPNVLTPNQAVIITATVANTSGASTLTPTGGTVTFFDANTASQIGSPTPLTNGTATLNLAGGFAALGTHNIFATYSGDSLGEFGASPASAQFPVNVGAKTSVTNIAFSTSPATIGQAVNITVTVVNASSASPVPSAGTVTIVDQTTGTTLGTPAVSGGTAVLGGVSFSTIGAHKIVATYSGDPTTFFNPSLTSAAFTENVNATTAVTNIAFSISPAALNQTVTLTATVANTSAGSSALPTGGTVTFTDQNHGNAVLGSANLVNGTAALSFAGFTTTGVHNIVAKYNGDAATFFNASATSAAFAETVVTTGSSTTVAVVTTSPVFGQAVTFQSTTTPTSGSFTSLTGLTVSFVDSTTNTSLGNGALSLSSGKIVATLTTSKLSVGTHAIKATFSGNSTFGGSSNTASATVAKATVTTTLTASAGSALAGVPLTFTATVKPPFVVSGTAPTGSVVFKNGTTTLATVALTASGANAVASFTTSSLVLGSHTITATYVPGSDPHFVAGVAGSASVSIITLASKLVVTTAPSNVQVNTAFGFVVSAENANGSTATAFTNIIPTVTVSTVPASGATINGVGLGGVVPVSVRFTNGILTVSGLKASANGKYTLTITAAGLSTTLTFTVGGGNIVG